MRGFNKTGKGGALKGTPASTRKGHPVAAKKPLVAPPPVAPVGVSGIKAATPVLDKLVSGAMGRGTGQVAVPQGAVPPSVLPKQKMVAARPPGLGKK